MQIPRGFADVMPLDARARSSASRCFLDTVAQWGYREVRTPSLEYASTFEVGSNVSDSLFRLVDADGGLLALRPDMTLPIARLSATRNTESTVPSRFCYVAPVFREERALLGQPREFTQMGVELIGDSGPSADAEIVALMIQALRACGVGSLSVSIGTVEVLAALVGAVPDQNDWGAAVTSAAHKADFVAIHELASMDFVPMQVEKALCALTTLRGPGAIDACRELTRGIVAERVFDDLSTTCLILATVVGGDTVQVDFSLLRDLDYYTGIVVEAHVPSERITLGGGGRYDNILSAYGGPAPAAGFALGLEEVVQALREEGGGQENLGDAQSVDVVVGGDPALAFAEASRLRAEGFVAFTVGGDENETARCAKEVGASRAFYCANATITPLRLREQKREGIS